MTNQKISKIKVVHIMRPSRNVYSIERVFTDIADNISPEISIKKWTCSFPSKGFFNRFFGALSAINIKGDIFHITGDTHYLISFLPSSKTILTIHDCEFILRARGLKKLLLWLFWLKIPLMKAGQITAISKKTKYEILSLVNIDHKRIRIIEDPVSPIFSYLPLPKKKTYTKILQIGTKQNKNIERLAAALSGLKVQLTIIGKLSNKQIKILNSEKISYECKFDVSDEELINIYRECNIVAFCSLSEGFGLPIIEAQSIGRPVITSKIEPMLSVAGDGAIFVNPEDIEDMRSAFMHLIENKELCNTLIHKGLMNSKKFSAKKIADKYENLYREIFVKYGARN